MTELVVPRDAVAVVIDFLRPLIAPVPVVPRVPHGYVFGGPGFVLVRRIGGGMRDIVTDHPAMVIESWGPDQGTADEQTQTVRAFLATMAKVSPLGVYRVNEISGPGFFTDPDTGTPTYEWSIQVALRANVVIV